MFWRVVHGSGGLVILVQGHSKVTLGHPPLLSLLPLSTGLQWQKPQRPMGKAPNAVSGDGTVIFQEQNLKIEIYNTYFYKQEICCQDFFFYIL